MTKSADTRKTADRKDSGSAGTPPPGPGPGLDHNSPIIALREWLASPPGQYMLQWEQSKLDVMTADIFGYHALQIGMPELDGLRANRMPYQWRTASRLPSSLPHMAALPSKAISLTHDFAELPFASQSIDLVVLPHVLEFSGRPHTVLREVERVLRPEGQMILSSFNPASLWGARQGSSFLLRRPFLPAPVELISLLRLKDWSQLLDMELNRGHFGCYAPAFRSQRWLDRFRFMEKAGDRWWPYFGAVYIVQAIKRTKGMTLVGPALVRPVRATAAAVPVTRRSGNNE